MRLIGINHLLPLLGSEKSTNKWVVAWVSEIRRASWKHGLDVRRQFPNAEEKDGEHFEFPVPESTAKIEMTIAFPHSIALITTVRET